MNTYISRQPIFDVNSDTAGYELLYRTNVKRGKKTPEEYSALLSEEFDALKGIYPTVFKNRRAFVSFTAEQIKDGLPFELPSKSLHIEVSVKMLTDRDVLAKCFELKRAGYSIVLNDFLYDGKNDQLFKFADVIKFSVNEERAKIDATADKCFNSHKPCLIYDVDTTEQFEFAKSIGCTFIEGYFYAKPVLETKQSGGPMIRTFLQILALVYCPDPDISHIAAVISTDPVLTIRLLRLINSLCSDTGNTVSTVHQALVMLGLDKLKEWVYLVGLQRLNREAPNELLKTALFRASFCEKLARVAPNSGMKPKELYLMGLISIVTGTDAAAADKALADLPISEEIKAALLGQDGAFSELYRLTLSYEHGKWSDVDDLSIKCSIDPVNIANQYVASLKFVNGFSKIGS